MKYIITENKLDKVVLTWLNNNFGNLTPIVKRNKTQYVNDNELPLFYYHQDNKNGFVYVNSKILWSSLETLFNMEYEQIQDVIKHWLKKTYNIDGLIPQRANVYGVY